MKEDVYKRFKEDKPMNKKTYENFKGGLKISKDFSTFVPPMAKQDFDLLLQNIKKDGYIRNALVTWNGIILDGHHRYKIAEMLDLDFKVKKMEFESVFGAQMWIAKNQTGQRRLSNSQLAVFAFNMLPMFTAIGKQKQSEGGKLKGKGKKGKPFKATKEAGLLARVNENAVKDIKAIHANVFYSPMVGMINCEMYNGLKISEAKSLIEQHKRGDFTTMCTENGELTEEAIDVLESIRKQAKEIKKETKKLKEKLEDAKEEIKKLKEELKKSNGFRNPFLYPLVHKEIKYSFNNLVTKADRLRAFEYDYCNDAEFRAEVRKIIVCVDKQNDQINKGTCVTELRQGSN